MSIELPNIALQQKFNKKKLSNYIRSKQEVSDSKGPTLAKK